MTSATPQGERPQRSQRFGAAWFFSTAALAILAMVASVLAPSGATSSSSQTEEAGVIRPMSNMVETLDDDNNGSGVVTLAQLRRDVLGNYGGTAAGIDVALIDTGVAPVDGLDGDNVIHGPDLSVEGTNPDVAYIDTYGHGTHMAGIIAGQRSGAEGIAPGARIVSLKTAGHDGVTSVAQVIAAIDWVIDNRNADGLNIRVLNLSLGQTGVEDHLGDELSAAVERAWQAGIVVIVAAGNDGDTQSHLSSPAVSPYVMAIGASDSTGGDDDDDDDEEDDEEDDDDGEDLEERGIPAWSARGDGARNPDVVAPGRSIASYRVPGSTVDTETPSARYGSDFFKGSGTSQAAAVASGLAALVIAENPELTPDQVKDAIRNRAITAEDYGRHIAGEGHIYRSVLTSNITTSTNTSAPSAVSQNHTPADAAGTDLVVPEPDEPTWSGGQWAGATWTGAQWAGATWTGATWSGAVWSGGQWAGALWAGAQWAAALWSGATWTGGQWAGGQWAGATWTGGTWTGGTWTGEGWE